jgi:serine protease Do
MIKKIFIVTAIVIVGGLSGIFFDRYFFPYISTSKLFSKYDFLKKSREDVTVINKTEQVYVKEESSLDKIANQVASSMVNIVSYQNPDIKNSPKNSTPLPLKNGAGMIVASDGLIMTYLSAINPDNSKYKILTSDGNVYDAQIQSTDSWSNLVFLKISASNLPVVSFGNSDDVRSGQKVIAVGNNQEEFQNRFASGQISDFNFTYNLSGKSLSISDKLEGVFETNIDFGRNYLGGPLVDYSGQVIGIVGSAEKNGATDFFGIPSNKARLVMDRAISKETSNNYQLGIYYIPLSKSYAIANNIPVEKGALIYSPSGQQGLAIIAGLPASQSDLKINDIITQINDDKITQTKNLPDLLYKYKKGDEITLTVLRNGANLNIKVNL